MEIQTAVKASSCSSMQLDEQVNSIQRKTEKLSITKDRYEIDREEYDKFITKAKKEINNFTQLIREVLNGDSLKLESVAPFDVEILDIYWNRIAEDVNLKATNDDVECIGSPSGTYVNIDMKYANIDIDYVNIDIDIGSVNIDMDKSVEMEEEIEELVMDSIERVKQLIISDKYPALCDDLQALRVEQGKWLFNSCSYSDSEDEDDKIRIGENMEIQTAVRASSSSCMQLSEQINTIKRKTDKLSITKDPYEISKEEYDKFINKTKHEINHFTQLIREFSKDSLKVESIAPFDVEILDIHWNRVEEVKDPNITYIRFYIYEATGLEELYDLIMESIRPVEMLIMSDEYPSLHDDLKALNKEQINWQQLMPDSDDSSESDSESEDEGMMTKNPRSCKRGQENLARNNVSGLRILASLQRKHVVLI